MYNWLKKGIIASSIILGMATSGFTQKYLSIEEATEIALEESYYVKQAHSTDLKYIENIQQAKKEIWMPTGQLNWSTNKNFQNILSFNFGLDWKYGRGANLKIQKNIQKNHHINTDNTKSAILRDTYIKYFEAKTTKKNRELKKDRLLEIKTIISQTTDSIMKAALQQAAQTNIDELETKIEQKFYRYDTQLEELYSILNTNRPKEDIVLLSLMPSPERLAYNNQIIENLQQNATKIKFQNIERNIENANLRKKIALGMIIPSMNMGYRYWIDQFTETQDNSIFISMTIPLFNKGKTKRQIAYSKIDVNEIKFTADFQKRQVYVQVKNEYNNWQEKVSAIPSKESVQRAKEMYEDVKQSILSSQPKDYLSAMNNSTTVLKVLNDYYNLLETVEKTTFEAFSEEMKLRQTHNVYDKPIQEIGATKPMYGKK